MLKKIVWSAAAALVTSAAAGLAYRLLVKGWVAARGEPPPQVPWWGRKFVGKRLQHNVQGRFGTRWL